MVQMRNETTKQGKQKLLEAGVTQETDSPSKSIERDTVGDPMNLDER